MGTDGTEVDEDSQYSIKVHHAMCTQLRTMVDKILRIFPDIEAARPGCSAGIQALCLLRGSVGKAKQLLQNCSESSRFYLAITSDATVSRFERTRKQLVQSLHELQSMVPLNLKFEISEIIDDLRRAIFALEPSEQDAGKAIRALLQKEEPILSSYGNSELHAIQFAASRLRLTSQKDLLIEKRSIKKMLDKVGDNEPSKRTILKYLHYILRKHDKLVLEWQRPDEPEPQPKPEPTLVADEIFTLGQYVNEEPAATDFLEASRNSALISGPQPSGYGFLEASSNSVSSCGSLAGLQLQIDFSNVSLGSVDTSFKNDSSLEFRMFSSTREIETDMLANIDRLPWESQCMAIEDTQNYLDYNTHSRVPLSLKNFVEPVGGFLKEADDRRDTKAKSAGVRLILTGVRTSRNAIRCMDEAFYAHLASFLGTEVTGDVLDIFELSIEKTQGAKLAQSYVLTSLVRILDTQNKDFQETTFNILLSLSSLDDSSLPKFFPRECIPRLFPFLQEPSFAGRCIVILEKLFYTEEARILAIETEGCISSVIQLLETGNCEEQEHALAILLSLCSQYENCCQLAMEEGVVPSLFGIAVNGNDKGKAIASELLRLLRDVPHEIEQEDNDDLCVIPSFEDNKKACSKGRNGFFGKLATKLKKR